MRWEQIAPECTLHSYGTSEKNTDHIERDGTRPRLLWGRTKHYGPGMQVGGDSTAGLERAQTIVSGWACDQRLLCDGRRQIFGFLIPGDTIKVSADHGAGPYSVIALTQLLLVSRAHDFVPNEDEREAMSRADAHWAAQREERLYDQLVRIGRLSARERAIHLLLELHSRLECVGLVRDGTFKVPVNQEVLADALGLSVVHINRTLRELRDDDLIRIKAGAVTLKNLPKLIKISGYVAPN